MLAAATFAEVGLQHVNGVNGSRDQRGLVFNRDQFEMSTRFPLDGSDIVPFGHELPDHQTAIVQFHNVTPLHPPTSHGECKNDQEGRGKQKVTVVSSGIVRDHHREEEHERQPRDRRRPLLVSRRNAVYGDQFSER